MLITPPNHIDNPTPGHLVCHWTTGDGTARGAIRIEAPDTATAQTVLVDHTPRMWGADHVIIELIIHPGSSTVVALSHLDGAPPAEDEIPGRWVEDSRYELAAMLDCSIEHTLHAWGTDTGIGLAEVEVW